MSCESERSVGNNPEAQALSHVHTHTQTVSTHHCALSPLLPLHTHNLTPVLLLLFLFSPPPITIFPQTLDFRAFILTVASHQTQLFTKVSKRTRQLARRQQQQIHTKLPQSPRRSSSSPETNNKERALIKVIGTHARDLSTPWHQPRATQRPAPSHHHSRHEGVAPVAALLERGQTFAIVIGLPSIKPLLCFAFSLLSLLCLSFIPLPHFSFLVSRATTALSAYTSFQEPNSQPKRPLPIFQQGHSVDFYPRFHG